MRIDRTRWMVVGMGLAALVGCDADGGGVGVGASSGATRYRVTVTAGTSTITATTPTAEGLSDDERAACGSLFDGTEDFVVVTGNQQVVDLAPSDVLAVKIAGNRNEVFVTLEPEPPTTFTTTTGFTTTTSFTTTPGTTTRPEPDFAGLCFVLSGNQARATVEVFQVALGSFAYIGRGNQPELALHVAGAASVGDVWVDLAGNGGTMTISGDGDYTCPDPEIAGNAGPVICEE